MRILNDDKLERNSTFPYKIYELLEAAKIYPSDKEAFIINSQPNVLIAQKALLAYKCKEALGYLNATLAFTMETAEFSVDFFNDYSLS